MYCQVLQLTKKKGHANLWSPLISYQLQIVINWAFTRQWHVHPGATLGWTTPSLVPTNSRPYRLQVHCPCANSSWTSKPEHNESSRVIAWCWMGRRCGKNHENITRIHQKVKKKLIDSTILGWPQHLSHPSQNVSLRCPKLFLWASWVVLLAELMFCWITESPWKGRCSPTFEALQSVKRPVKDKTLGAGSWNCLAR